MPVTTQKFHGAALAKGTNFANFHLDSLAAAPTGGDLSHAGRLFYNSTTRSFGLTRDDGAAGLEADSFYSLSEFTQHLANMASTTDAAGMGTKIIGFDGHSATNGLAVIAAGTLEATLDAIIDLQDSEAKALDDYQADALSQAATKGTNLMGYEGKVGANGQFSVAAGTLKTSLDSIVTQADANAQAIIDLNNGAVADVQAEVDLIEAAMGSVIGTDGNYVAHVGTNYINTNTSVTEDLTDLDTQAKANADAIAQEIVDRGNADDLKLDLAGGVMSGAIGMGNNKITNLDTPTDANDAVNKQYADDLFAGITSKYSVRAASTASIADLSNVSVSLDGLTLIEGDRVLVKDNASPDGVAAVSDIHNGIYVVGTVTAGFAPLIRAADFDGTPTHEVPPGAFCFVSDGTANGNNGFSVTSEGSLTGQMHDVGTDSLEFTQTSGAGQIIAGNGLSRNGNELYLNFGAGVAMRPNDEIGIDNKSTGGLFTTLDGTTQSDDADAEQAIKIDTTDATHGATVSTSANGLRVAQGVIDLINTNESGLASEITNRTNADSAIQTELDASQTAIGASMAADGTYVAHTGKNYINGNTTITNDVIDLDTQAKANADGIANEITNRANADSALQTELDDTQTGAGLAADGAYAANGAANYISGASSLKNADDLLDGQLKSTQDETDKIEAALGAMVDANGDYVAFVGSNYMDAAADVAAALSALDTQVKANADGSSSDVAALQTELDNTQASIGAAVNADGTFAALALDGGNYMDSSTTITGALLDLDTQIKANADQQSGDQSVLQTEVDNIETALGSMLNADGTFNDTALDGGNYMDASTTVAEGLLALDTQVKTNEDGVAANLAEINNMEAALGAMVDTSGNYVAFSGTSYMDAAADSAAAMVALDTGLNQEVTDRAAAIAALKTAINDKVYNYQSGAAAAIHNINHALNSAFTQVTVKVQDGTLYYNHGVLVEEVDNNNIMVTLSAESPANIKVMIQDMTDIT